MTLESALAAPYGVAADDQLAKYRQAVTNAPIAARRLRRLTRWLATLQGLLLGGMCVLSLLSAIDSERAAHMADGLFFGTTHFGSHEDLLRTSSQARADHLAFLQSSLALGAIS